MLRRTFSTWVVFSVCVVFWNVAAAAAAFVPFSPAQKTEEGDKKSQDLERVQITVRLQWQRSIGGISELNRASYFAVCDHGTDFDNRVSPEVYDYLVRQLNVEFGRDLGLVIGQMRWGVRVAPKEWIKPIREDINRPGFADIDYYKEIASRRFWGENRPRGPYPPGDKMRQDFPRGLDVVNHGRTNAYPDFMGRHVSDWLRDHAPEEEAERIPANIEAAAELAAAILQYNYSRFNRPRYYELVNEPHWSYPSDPHFQRWHLETMKAVREKGLEVQVGGPCLSVAYFYRNQYNSGSYRNFKSFIDGTNGGLDFYSFHSYDFFREGDGDFGGRVTSGLPLEGVLDAVSNYTFNAYGKEVGLVFSEHGGYDEGNEFTRKLARKHIPGESDDFEWEKKMRSISDFNMVSSALANTLVFMDHPHVVKKAVPFILVGPTSWDRKYYASMYVNKGYEPDGEILRSHLSHFYEFFRDLQGHRVVAFCSSPDIQTRAFVSGHELFVVFNNLSNNDYMLDLDMPRPEQMLVRRLRRREDFTPELSEACKEAFAGQISIYGREAVLVRAGYPRCGRSRRKPSTVIASPFKFSRARVKISG